MNLRLRQLLFIFMLFKSFGFYAQSDRMREKRDKIKSLKIAFISLELDLTSSEAEKFWPVYNAYEDKMFEIRHQSKSIFSKRIREASVSQMTEKEANAFLSQMEDNDEQVYLLNKKLIVSLREIIPVSKIILLKKLEEDFNRKLLHRYRESRDKEYRNKL